MTSSNLLVEWCDGRHRRDLIFEHVGDHLDDCIRSRDVLAVCVPLGVILGITSLSVR
jgi:hypothetical protein